MAWNVGKWSTRSVILEKVKKSVDIDAIKQKIEKIEMPSFNVYIDKENDNELKVEGGVKTVYRLVFDINGLDYTIIADTEDAVIEKLIDKLVEVVWMKIMERESEISDEEDDEYTDDEYDDWEDDDDDW